MISAISRTINRELFNSIFSIFFIIFGELYAKSPKWYWDCPRKVSIFIIFSLNKSFDFAHTYVGSWRIHSRCEQTLQPSCVQHFHNRIIVDLSYLSFRNKVFQTCPIHMDSIPYIQKSEMNSFRRRVQMLVCKKMWELRRWRVICLLKLVIIDLERQNDGFALKKCGVVYHIF